MTDDARRTRPIPRAASPAAAARDRRSRALPIVGWREWIEFPEFGGRAIKAKIDTGARSSAIHAFDIEIVRSRGRRVASFEVHPEQRSVASAFRVQAEIVDERGVRSSTGHIERRLVVLMELHLLGETWTSEVTLAQRDQMGFRMLLGREALRHRFVVDPARSFLGGRPVRRRKKKPPV